MAVTTAKIIALREAAAGAEEAVVTEEVFEQASTQDSEPIMKRTYTVHASHPPQNIVLNNVERVGIVSAINCSGPCTLMLCQADGKMLFSLSSPNGCDMPIEIPFAGPLVAELKTASSVTFTIIS